MRVVIVGGGVGGPACGRARLAKRGGGIDVQLIERTLRHDVAPSFLWRITDDEHTTGNCGGAEAPAPKHR